MRSRGLAELLNLPSFATCTCLDRPNLSLRVLCVQELVLKIAILAEKNAPNFGWYVDVLLSTLVHFQSLNASFLSCPLHFLASDCISLHQFAPFYVPLLGMANAYSAPPGGFQDVGECSRRCRSLRLCV